MKLQFVSALFIATLALAGCNSRTSPENVVKSAGYALEKNDLNAFRATLSDSALQRYGSESGMRSLQKKFKKDSSILDTRATSKRREGNGDRTNYAVTVGVDGRPALTLTVSCTEETERTYDPDKFCHVTGPDHEVDCRGGWETTTRTDCLITNAR